MRTINIIACGSTGSLWDGRGDSLGVNDCWKFGKPTEGLLVINSPQKFNASRLNTIVTSKPQKFYSQLMIWEKYFPLELIHISRYRGRLTKGRLDFAETSPFVAISMAYSWDYEEIILWGVDFVDHKIYGKGSDEYKNERTLYKDLIDHVERAGVKVYLGAYGSALGDFIEVKDKMVTA